MQIVEILLPHEEYNKMRDFINNPDNPYVNVGRFMLDAIRDLSKKHGEWPPRETSIYDEIKKRRMPELRRGYSKSNQY